MTSAGPPPAARVDRRRLRTTAGLVLGLLGPRANLAVSGVLLTLLVSSRVSSAVAITFALSANRLIGWAAYPVMGRLSDHRHGRAGRRAPFMAAGLVVMGVCTYSYPSVPGYWPLVLLIVATKLASVVSGLTNLAVIPEAFGKSRTAKALVMVGVLGALMSLAIKGTVLATWRTGDPRTWALAFHLAGVIMLVAALVVLVLVREAPAAKRAADLERTHRAVPWHEELRLILRQPNAPVMAAGVMLFWAGLSATGYLSFVYFQKVQHAGAGTQTLAGWIAGAPVLVAGALGGWFISRHLTRRQVGMAMPAAGAVVSILQSLSTHIWQTVVLAFVGGPLLGAFVISLAPLLVELLPRSGGLGELLGKFVAPFSVFGLAFAFLAGWAVDATGSYKVIWLFPAAGGVLQALVMTRLRLEHDQPAARAMGDLPGRLAAWSEHQMGDRNRRLFAGTVTVADADTSTLFESARRLFTSGIGPFASLASSPVSDPALGHPSRELARVAEILRDSTSALADLPVDVQRTGWEGVTGSRPLLEGVQVSEVEVAGVRAEWVTAAGADDRRVIVHFHAGGYVIGSALTHREFASRLSAVTGAAVLVPEYRLAPEHPFPAAANDARAVYRQLSSGRPRGTVIVSGDSAGGGLALLVAQGEPGPAALVCWSPWVDLSRTPGERADAVITPAWISRCADLYAGAADRRDPRLSPLYGPLAGLPPTLVLVGTGEVLAPDALALDRRARAAGSQVELVAYDHDVHLWMLLAPDAPESVEALEAVADFADRVWAPQPASD